MAGGKLDGAKNAKADEFYTQLSDIEKEVKNYKEHFKTKLFFVIVMTLRIQISIIILCQILMNLA